MGGRGGGAAGGGGGGGSMVVPHPFFLRLAGLCFMMMTIYVTLHYIFVSNPIYILYLSNPVNKTIDVSRGYTIFIFTYLPNLEIIH